MNRTERAFAESFVAQIGGTSEVWLEFGRCDVIHAGFAIEVEPVRTWREGVRQALAYAALTPYKTIPRLQPAVALFGGPLDYGQASVILHKLTRIGVGLYLHNADEWHYIRNDHDLRPPLDRARPVSMTAGMVSPIEAARMLGLPASVVRTLVESGDLVEPLTIGQLEEFVMRRPA